MLQFESHSDFTIINTFRNADLVIGGQNWHSLQSKHFIDSHAYFQDDITWCVQHAKLRDEWDSFFRTVEPNVFWLIFGVALPFIANTYFFAAYERRMLDIWLSMLLFVAVVSQQAFNYHPKRSSGRVFSAMSLQMTFFAVSSFVAIIFKSMTQINYGTHISSLDEITNENFRLVADKDTRNYLIDRNLVIDALTLP